MKTKILYINRACHDLSTSNLFDSMYRTTVHEIHAAFATHGYERINFSRVRMMDTLNDLHEASH